MTPKDCFGVVVRSVGLLVLLLGVYELLGSIYVLVTPSRHHNATSPVYIVYGVFFVALSLYFLCGAPGLMQFSYPDMPPSEQSRGDDNP